MRRVGAAVREGTLSGRKGISPMDLLDKLASFSSCGGRGPEQLTTG